MGTAFLPKPGADEMGAGTDDHQGRQEAQQDVDEGHHDSPLHSLGVIPGPCGKLLCKLAPRPTSLEQFSGHLRRCLPGMES